jgi:hypothetical protein
LANYISDPEGEILTVEYNLGTSEKFLKCSTEGRLDFFDLSNSEFDTKSKYVIKIDIKDPEGAQTEVSIPIVFG